MVIKLFLLEVTAALFFSLLCLAFLCMVWGMFFVSFSTAVGLILLCLDKKKKKKKIYSSKC